MCVSHYVLCVELCVSITLCVFLIMHYVCFSLYVYCIICKIMCIYQIMCISHYVYFDVVCMLMNNVCVQSCNSCELI